MVVDSIIDLERRGQSVSQWLLQEAQSSTQCPSRLLLLAVPLLLLLAAVLAVLAVLAALPGLLALAGRPDIREAAGLWGWTGCGGAAVEGLRRRGEWLCVVGCR